MALSGEVLADLQQKIFNQFLSLKLSEFKSILTYSALILKKEFDISLINRYVHSINPDAVFALPRIREIYQMDAVKVELNGDHIISSATLNQYGISEPINGTIVEPMEIDLVFVPLLAFDENGYRVGYGKGYYDRFLSHCRQDVLKIGFSFFEAEPAIEDIDNYDVPLNLCITPLNVYEF